MFTLEFSPETVGDVSGLMQKYPDYFQPVKSRGITGGGGDLTLVVSLAAVAIPAIKAVLIELIKAKKAKSATFDGKKFSGYDAAEIKTILKKLDELQD